MSACYLSESQIIILITPLKMMIFILYFIFLPLLDSMVIGHRSFRHLEATVIMNQKNYFDGQYFLYTSNSHQIFPYNSREVCLVEHSGNDREAKISLESAYSNFHKYAQKIMPIAKGVKIEACFEYKGHSILIYQRQGETHLIRSGNEKIFQFQRKIEQFSFDHFLATLYAQIDGTIYRLDLQNIVDNFWLAANQSEHKNVHFLIEPIKYLPPNLDNYMIVNTVLYWLENDSIYKSALDLNEKIFVSKIGATKFIFIPFAIERIAPNILFAAKNDKMSKRWFLYYLAILKTLIIVLLLWYYRKPMAKGIQKRFKKTSSDSEESEQYRLAGGIYPSTPLFIPQRQ